MLDCCPSTRLAVSRRSRHDLAADFIELPGLVPRHAESLVTEALGDTGVVLVNGARQAGRQEHLDQVPTPTPPKSTPLGWLAVVIGRCGEALPPRRLVARVDRRAHDRC